MDTTDRVFANVKGGEKLRTPVKIHVKSSDAAACETGAKELIPTSTRTNDEGRALSSIEVGRISDFYAF